MKRNNGRIKAMMLCYNYEITNGDCCDELSEGITKEIGDDVDEEFAMQLFQGVISNLEAIDKTISYNLENYTIERLNYVDRALLRIGTYEMQFMKSPKNIVINEIVNISKKYSQIDNYESSKFNNKVLDKIAGYLGNE